MTEDLRINGERLLSRIEELASIGAIDGGGSCRLALTDEDRAGRDLVVAWMRDLDLEINIDSIGSCKNRWFPTNTKRRNLGRQFSYSVACWGYNSCASSNGRISEIKIVNRNPRSFYDGICNWCKNKCT